MALKHYYQNRSCCTEKVWNHQQRYIAEILKRQSYHNIPGSYVEKYYKKFDFYSTKDKVFFLFLLHPNIAALLKKIKLNTYLLYYIIILFILNVTYL